MNASIKSPALLCAEIRAAKLQETAAKDHRTALEAQLVSLFPQAREGVEETIKGDGFQIEYKVTRKVDSDKLFSNFGSLPGNAQKAFRFKAEVALTHFRALADMDSATFAVIAPYVTTTNAKPAVTLKD